MPVGIGVGIFCPCIFSASCDRPIIQTNYMEGRDKRDNVRYFGGDSLESIKLS